MKALARSLALCLALVAATATAARAQVSDLDTNTKARIDAEAQRIVAETGVPSAQVGIARNGKIIYAAAFGLARISPPMPATPEMHYPVGSISKQFTATCVLLLQQRGKLKLDDPVSNWFPELTRSHDITLRMLLTHTSGYSDYGTEDYTLPSWTKPVNPIDIIHEWAERPLDFEPGTKWQYSNTNFMLAGLIVQKVADEPFNQFLRENVLAPLHLDDIYILDTQRNLVEPEGYMRHALGPPRPALIESATWYFAAGQLAMPVRMLLDWDIALINQSLLTPASYQQMFTEQHLKNGDPTGYGLGIQVGRRNNHPVLSHGGEVGGYVAQETMLPSDNLAVVVLTNLDASRAASEISNALVNVLLPTAAAAPASVDKSHTTAQARKILEGLAKGQIDRSLFEDNANFYFNQQALDDFRDSLTPLGPLTDFRETQNGSRGGMTMRAYLATYGNKKCSVLTYWMPNGKIEQFLLEGN